MAETVHYQAINILTGLTELIRVTAPDRGPDPIAEEEGPQHTNLVALGLQIHLYHLLKDMGLHPELFIDVARMATATHIIQLSNESQKQQKVGT